MKIIDLIFGYRKLFLEAMYFMSQIYENVGKYVKKSQNQVMDLDVVFEMKSLFEKNHEQ